VPENFKPQQVGTQVVGRAVPATGSPAKHSVDNHYGVKAMGRVDVLTHEMEKLQNKIANLGQFVAKLAQWHGTLVGDCHCGGPKYGVTGATVCAVCGEVT
jgi:hypothetical protein